jgi:hypothetical protein
VWPASATEDTAKASRQWFGGIAISSKKISATCF